MSEQTPSQAEGERGPDTGTGEQPASGHPEAPRTTPSQAEGDRTEEEETEAADHKRRTHDEDRQEARRPRN